MISYEEAKKIALGVYDTVNSCREYKNAYDFVDTNFKGVGSDGVVVLKEDGKPISWTTFLLHHIVEGDEGKKIPF